MEESNENYICCCCDGRGKNNYCYNALLNKLPNSAALYFDDYTLEGETEDFHKWVLEGADYNMWNLKPLENDILKIAVNMTILIKK